MSFDKPLDICEEHGLPSFKSDGQGKPRCYKCYGYSKTEFRLHHPEFAHQVPGGKTDFSKRIKEMKKKIKTP